MWDNKFECGLHTLMTRHDMSTYNYTQIPYENATGKV